MVLSLLAQMNRSNATHDVQVNKEGRYLDELFTRYSCGCGWLTLGNACRVLLMFLVVHVPKFAS
jgi:hypothetical protein